MGESWLPTGCAALVVLVLLVVWSRTRIARPAGRALGWSTTAAAVVFTLLGLLNLAQARVGVLLTVLGCGELVVLAGVVFGVTRWARWRRRERLWRSAPEAVPSWPAKVWVRPRRRETAPPAGLLDRVDRWLATDGPTPTEGWWHNGGLIVDERGAALVDAAGLRHPLPAETAKLVHLTAPRAVLLMDARQSLLARLPTAGFDHGDLRRFCAVVGWRYDRAPGFGREARDAVDLRSSVVDQAARR